MNSEGSDKPEHPCSLARALLFDHPIGCEIVHTGFIQVRLCKIQGLLKTFLLFSRTENLRKKTDLHVKILLRKC